MTTATWSSRLRMDTAATYQEWRDELITKLGLMVTAGKLGADETNITPGVGSQPTANTEGGYAVYHLSDSLHGTAPIYIRFGFGSGSTNQVPRIQITTGTSTNGSGVLGGTCLSTIATAWGADGIAMTTDTARTSYMCANAGFFGLSWKIRGSISQDAVLFVQRTCDNTGAITATGYMLWCGNNGAGNAVSKAQHFRMAATAVAYTARTAGADIAICLNPSREPSTLVGSDVQVFLCWMWTPTVVPVFGFCGCLDAEIAVGVTFSTTLVGTSPRTYIGLQVTLPYGPAAAQPTTGTTTPAGPKFAMLWE